MVMERFKNGLRAVLSRVLGPDGQSVATGDLSEPQSARLINLHREWASHPARGLTPSKLQTILESAEQGDVIAQFELFEDMEERDGHIASEFGKRRRALLGLEWDVVPPPNASAKEKKAANAVKEVIEGLNFETLLFDLTDAVGKGFACLELEWQRMDGVWVPKAVDHRPQTWFQFHRGSLREEIRLRDQSAEGAVLQPLGWIVHTHKARSGYLARASLFRCLVWPYLFKNYSVGDLAEFLEIYGIPLRIGKYPQGASEKDKSTLLRALASIGHNAAGIIPDGMMLDFHDAATGDPDAFMAMIDWCERTQSKVIVGSTLTSQADRGSNTNALGNVHNEVRHDIRDSDARQIEGTLTRDLIYPIAVLNGWADAPARAPRLRLQTQEPEDITAFSTGLPALVALGMRVPRQWAQQKLGIPEPEEGEDVLAAAAAPVSVQADPLVADPLATDPKGKRAKATAETSPPEPGTPEQADNNDAVEIGTELLLERLDPAIGGWMESVRQALGQATSLEGFRDGLIELLPQMPIELIAREMAQALAVAGLAGRAAIADLVVAEAQGALSIATAQAGAGVIHRGWQPAAEFFMQKVNLPTRRWTDLWQGQHARAFVVAGAMREDVLTELRRAVEDAVVNGHSFDSFQRDFEDLVARTGWTGWTGEGTAKGRAWRARVIYKTNMLTARAAGSYQQMTDPDTLAHMPYWQYRHNTLVNPREEHQSWNGIVLLWNDPWWQTHFPPNGWFCRCDVRPLSERQMRKLGKSGPDTAPAPGPGDPPEEWAYNPGEAAWGKPVAQSILKAERGGRMVALDSRGPADFGRPDAVPLDVPVAELAARITDPTELLPAFRKAIGGESAIYVDPTGTRINITDAIIGHWQEDLSRLQGREQYLPMLRELVEQPFEVWAGFARNELTGKVELRRRYVKALDVGKSRVIGLVADATAGQWVSFNLFSGGLTGANNLRTGMLLWGRGG